MALDLQAQHSEYSRKKRAAFQHLVGEVYQAHRKELCGYGKRKSGQGDGTPLMDEEEWLIQKEQEHLKKNRENVAQDG